MKIIIDEKVCTKHKMTPVEVLFALAIRSSESPKGELLNMENREILVKDRDVYKVTQHWSDVLDEIISDSSGKVEKSDEEILDATKRYVASFQGNYTGMRLIKYFILKDDVKPSEDGQGHVEQISDLATFLENKESEEEVVTNDDSWLMNSRN